MILTLPGPAGTEQQDVPNTDLAARFWASPWGRSTHLTGQGVTAPMFDWLTGKRATGGLDAAWDDHEGLRELRDRIIITRPEGPPCPS